MLADHFVVLIFSSQLKLLILLQTKLKSAVQLQDLLDATRLLVPRPRYS